MLTGCRYTVVHWLTRLQVGAASALRSSYSPQENRLFFTTAEKILCMSFRSAYCTSGPGLKT